MSENNTAVATTAPKTAEVQTLTSLLRNDNIKARIESMLKDRAPQFTSSLLSLANSSAQLRAADPKTILAAAMTAATLDLPINPNLGFAYIVPYKTTAQFQMGYKGFIQLAMRSGQYKRMNAVCVNQEAIGGVDDMGETIINWTAIDETKPAVGYVFAFELVNGFRKVAYWPKSKVQAHAGKYSQAFRGGRGTPWQDNFDAMALKTVAKLTLAKWGPLTVAMEKAIVEDQGIKHDVDDAPTYVDAEEVTPSAPRELKRGNADAPPVSGMLQPAVDAAM